MAPPTPTPVIFGARPELLEELPDADEVRLDPDLLLVLLVLLEGVLAPVTGLITSPVICAPSVA